MLLSLVAGSLSCQLATLKVLVGVKVMLCCMDMAKKLFVGHLPASLSNIS